MRSRFCKTLSKTHTTAHYIPQPAPRSLSCALDIIFTYGWPLRVTACTCSQRRRLEISKLQHFTWQGAQAANLADRPAVALCRAPERGHLRHYTYCPGSLVHHGERSSEKNKVYVAPELRTSALYDTKGMATERQRVEWTVARRGRPHAPPDGVGVVGERRACCAVADRAWWSNGARGGRSDGAGGGVELVNRGGYVQHGYRASEARAKTVPCGRWSGGPVSNLVRKAGLGLGHLDFSLTWTAGDAYTGRAQGALERGVAARSDAELGGKWLHISVCVRETESGAPADELVPW